MMPRIVGCKSRNGSNQHEATTKCWSRSCCNQAKKEEKHVLQPRLKETNKRLQPRLKGRSRLRSMKNQKIIKISWCLYLSTALPWAQEAKKGLLQALQWVLGERESLAYELKAICDVFICLFCLLSTCIRSMQILYFEDFLLVKMTCLCTDGWPFVGLVWKKTYYKPDILMQLSTYYFPFLRSLFYSAARVVSVARPEARGSRFDPSLTR